MNLPTHSFCVSDSLFLKVNPSPNNLKGNPYGLNCPQTSNRGSCPLINLSCPFTKHWISLQDCCIIQRSRGYERKSVVWSHLTLGRVAKRKRLRWRRGRNEGNGRGVVEEDRKKWVRVMMKKAKGKKCSLRFKRGTRSNARCGSRQRELLKDHIHMRNRRRVLGSHTGSPCPAVSSLLLLTTHLKTTHIFSCIYFDRRSNEKLTTSLCSPCSFIVDHCYSSEQTLSQPRNTSVFSFSLIKYTPCHPHPHPTTNTMAKNTVVMYHWFIQKHTDEINGTLMAVVATQRAVIIKRFGMVKVQCSHAVFVAAGKHSGRNKRCGPRYLEMNRMKCKADNGFIHALTDLFYSAHLYEHSGRLSSYAAVKISGNNHKMVIYSTFSFVDM